MIHRHLDYDDSVAPEQRGAGALDDLLDRGDLDDWAPIARAVEADPFGPVAEDVERICHAHPMYGTGPLWRAYLERCRLRAAGPPTASGESSGWSLARLRRSCGLTQVGLAARLGISQSDLSKLERRADVRLSTIREYVSALGARLELVVHRPRHLPVNLRFPERNKETGISGKGAGAAERVPAGGSR